MHSVSRKALYVNEKCEFMVQSGLETYDNGDDELLIETLFSGINPADSKHATQLGIRPTVLGYDFCGRVLSAPAGSQFNKGDIVAGCTPPSLGRPTKFGTHQRVLVCPEDVAWKVPSNLPHSHAAAITVVAMTAADALYNVFAKPMPGAAPATLDKSPILIWGASSSGGLCAVQFARASGVQNILVTASPARHNQLRALGATQCFDYASTTVVDDISTAIEALGQGPLACALDAVGSRVTSPTSAELVARCVPDPTVSLVSVVLEENERFRMVYGMPKYDFVIQPSGLSEPIRIPARPADHQRSWEALQWAVENYGSGFMLPVVDIVTGTAEQALVAMIQVGKPGKGFGKTVIQHPMK